MVYGFYVVASCPIGPGKRWQGGSSYQLGRAARERAADGAEGDRLDRPLRGTCEAKRRRACWAKAKRLQAA
eukprot:2433039-Alexandrium_andersonii.AAC.1